MATKLTFESPIDSTVQTYIITSGNAIKTQILPTQNDEESRYYIVRDNSSLSEPTSVVLERIHTPTGPDVTIKTDQVFLGKEKTFGPYSVSPIIDF